MTIQAAYYLVLILGVITKGASSFSTPLTIRQGSFIVTRQDVKSNIVRFMSNEENSAPKRRRKRKEGKTVEDVTNSSSQNLQPSIPSEKPPVEMKVMDVRDIVSGTSTDSDDVTSESMESSSTPAVSSSFSSSSSDDSLERLLADAKKMRMESSTDEDEDGGISAPKAIKSAISTIVTIDFFVVCGLLLWFLAGIFCSYILKDDAVQISFNMIFEPVVQPALGILMIGSAAGAVFKDGNE